MLDNLNQFGSEPLHEDHPSKPGESVDDSTESRSEAQPEYPAPDKKLAPQQDVSQVPLNPSLDEYLEIHYQLTKFQQRPLIRIAAGSTGISPRMDGSIVVYIT
jgi:hypothetical protein